MDLTLVAQGQYCLDRYLSSKYHMHIEYYTNVRDIIVMMDIRVLFSLLSQYIYDTQ